MRGMLARLLFPHRRPDALERRRFKPAWVVVAALFCAVLFGSTIAEAVSPAGVPDGNTFKGCRKITTGALRIIDPSQRQKCTSAEKPLSWTTWKWRGAWLSTAAYFPGDLVYDVTCYWSQSGVQLHSFSSPLELVLSTGDPTVVPATLENGAWQPIPLVPTPGALPSGWSDGFLMEVVTGSIR